MKSFLFTLFACLLAIHLTTAGAAGSPIHKLHHATGHDAAAAVATHPTSNEMKSNTKLIESVKEVIAEVKEIIESETPPAPVYPYLCGPPEAYYECTEGCKGSGSNQCACLTNPSPWAAVFNCYCSESCPTNTTRTQELVNVANVVREEKESTNDLVVSQTTQSVPITVPLPHTCGTQTGSCPNNCQGGAFNYCECQEQSFGSNVYSCYCSNYCPQDQSVASKKKTKFPPSIAPVTTKQSTQLYQVHPIGPPWVHPTVNEAAEADTN